MAYRGNYTKKPKQRSRLPILLLIVALTAAVVTGAYYCSRADNAPAVLKKLGEFCHSAAVKLGFAEDSLATNPYKPEDYTSNGGLIECSASEVSLTGIDVSSHQAEIDWQAVAGAGIRFAIIRAGYRGYDSGFLHLDERFEANLSGAQAAGLDTGVYFYSQAVTADEAREEAQFVLDALAGRPLTYPIMFDWEINGDEPRTAQIDAQTLTDCALAFCEEIEDAGYRAGIYFNQSFGYLRYDLKKLSQYELWLAEYNSYQSFLYEVSLWQYTNEATIPGIDCTVDLNLSYRDYGA